MYDSGEQYTAEMLTRPYFAGIQTHSCAVNADTSNLGHRENLPPKALRSLILLRSSFQLHEELLRRRKLSSDSFGLCGTRSILQHAQSNLSSGVRMHC